MSRPRFVPGKHMEFTSRIRDVLDATECDLHNAPVGVPCFQVRMDSQEGYYAAICNGRAAKIFDGVPTIRSKNFNKEKR